MKYLFILLIMSAGAGVSAQDTITLSASSPLAAVPSDFTGVSYESYILDGPNLVPSNTALIQYFKTLSVKVLRIGGNSVEYYIYYPGMTAHYYAADTVTPMQLDSLFGFAAATGVKVILGLNFGGHFDASLAAKETHYVMQHYASQLLAFEIGNEPNLYASNGWRSANYTYADYQIQFMKYVDSITYYDPAAPISGPAAARQNGLSYSLPFCAAMHGVISLLTQHNYAIYNSGASPDTLIGTMLGQAPLDTILEIADTLVSCGGNTDGVPFRMSECNSMYPYGVEGVSNTCATALWGLDYMYALAQAGVSGVNFHNALASPSCYIYDTLGVYTARPLYYGILAFQYGSQGRFIPVRSTDTTKNMHVYAVIDTAQNIYITLINKDTLNPIGITMATDSGLYTGGQMVGMTMPSASAITGITLAGDTVTEGGVWSPGAWQPVSYTGGYFTATVPAAAALIIKLNAPTVGLHDIPACATSLSVYPDPAADILNVQGSDLISEVTVTDLPGQTILETHYTTTNSLVHMDVSKMPEGVYIARVIYSSGESASAVFVKKQ